VHNVAIINEVEVLLPPAALAGFLVYSIVYFLSYLLGHAVEPPLLFLGRGRPKGSRNKLGEAFLGDLYADWVENGVAVIQKVRETCPDVYLKVVASIVPKQLEIERDPFDGVTDDQLAAIIAYAKAALGIPDEGGAEAGPTH
jgi:hypothetical protein